MNVQFEKNIVLIFVELKSQPTPFGGRSAASSGPRWAGRFMGVSVPEQSLERVI